MIDPGLAAHRGIHLGEEGGGDLNERYAALITGGGETGHVADHAAAQGNERDAAIAVVLQQRIEDAVQNFQGLVLLAVRQNHGVGLQAREGGLSLLQIERRHRVVGDDQHLSSGDMRPQQIGAR